MEHKVARNFRGQHEEVKKNAPKIIKMLSTSDVRVKRSTAFESTRDAEMMQDSAVTMTSDSSTRSSDFTEASGLSQDVSKSETNLTSENANLLNTTQTLSQSENVSKNLTAATVTATETTTKSPVNQNDSESYKVDCPLRIYPAILGVFTGNKIYGLLKKPCGDHNKPPEYDQDYVGFILQTIEEFLKDSVHFTSQLLSNISKFTRNDILIEELKKVDFECSASEKMPENETTAENRTVKLHTSLLKSYALLDLAIKKKYQNDTLRYDGISGEVRELMEKIKSLVCGIEKLLVYKGIDIVNFPLYSSPDDDAFPQLSFDLYVYIHVNQVYSFLRDFSSNETWSKLWLLY